MFNVSPRARARLFQRLHRLVAIFAAHQLATLGQRLPQTARHPPPAHLHLALRHHRPLLRHAPLRCPWFAGRVSIQASLVQSPGAPGASHLGTRDRTTPTAVIPSEARSAESKAPRICLSWVPTQALLGWAKEQRPSACGKTPKSGLLFCLSSPKGICVYVLQPPSSRTKLHSTAAQSKAPAFRLASAWRLGSLSACYAGR